MNNREKIINAKRIVFKFGTNILTRDDGNLAISRIYSFIESIADLKQQNKEIIIVTSGAIGLGAKKLKLKSKPKEVPMQKACAAVGQSQLISIYEEAFDRFSIYTAQLLVTSEDLSNRQRYLSLRSTMTTLLENGVIPIINENDAVSPTDDFCYILNNINICFNDNDKLSALIMSKMGCDLLVILSDVEGLYDDDPRVNPEAKLISFVEEINQDIEKLGFEPSSKGRGGMKTKLEAAKIAVHSGGYVVIANGNDKNIINDLFEGKDVGTVFLPGETLSSKKRWIAYASNIKGQIKVNEGAKKALIEKNSSLLPSGVIGTQKHFMKGDVVSIVDEENNEFARGIINYSYKESQNLIGKKLSEIKTDKGVKIEELITRDNIVILED